MTGAPQVRWDEAISFAAGLSTVNPPSWVSVAQRVKGQAGVTRGRQYESDQQQAGQYQPTLINQDGALSPVNTSSPFWPNVTPRRPYRKRFQYPITANILSLDQATGGSTQANGAVVDSVVPPWTSFGFFWHILAQADAFVGPNVFSQSITSAQSAPFAAADMDGWSILPGAAHSAQVQMRAPAGLSNVQVRVVLLWRTTNNAVIASSVGSTVTLVAGSSTWVPVTVSGVAPTSAAGGTLQIQMVNSVTTNWQASGFQVEYATSPSTWGTPGTWYPVLSGWTDRFPVGFDKNGTYTLSTPTVLDSFAVLSQLYPPPPFYADVLALGPSFFYPLDDPEGAAVFRELTGNLNPATEVSSPTGVGTIATGQGIQSTLPSGGILGAPGSVVTMTNPNTGSVPNMACSAISLSSTGTTGFPTGLGTGWSRMIAFNNSGAGTTAGALWVASNPSFVGTQNIFDIGLGATPSAGIVFELFSSTAGSIWSPPVGSFSDGNWHLMIVTLSANEKTCTVYMDGSVVFTNTTATSQSPSGVTSDNIGAFVYPGANQFYEGYNGSVAHAAQFNFPLTAAQVTALYNSWRPAWSPEPSGERYQRILAWANYVGPQQIQGGNTLDMGPANDVDGQTDAFTLLSNVVTTEAGNHYVRADGTVVFEQRSTRYDQLNPTFTFGSNVAGGEFPFADLGFDFDLDHVANQAEITINASGQVITVPSAASQAQYGTLTLQRTINVVNQQEAVDAANYTVNRYNQPQLRVDSITLAPSRYSPDGGVTFPLWAVCGQLEISTRIRINMRPLGQPLIQFDGFVEQVNWTVDPDSGDTLLVAQVSPADLNLYWVLSALHTTVHTAATAGSNTVVLDALPDSASNPASASFCSGLQLTLDSQNPALSETLTVASFSATSPGYTTFTVTFTTNLAHNHAVGSIAVEKLGVGQTIPTAWDIASVLGSTTTLAY